MNRMTSGVAFRASGRVLPPWVIVFHVLSPICIVVIAVLNWKFAIALFLVVFGLKVLPVAENIGEIFMRPFLRQSNTNSPEI